eukprot:410173-Rhodomonas_salina.2
MEEQREVLCCLHRATLLLRDVRRAQRICFRFSESGSARGGQSWSQVRSSPPEINDNSPLYQYNLYGACDFLYLFSPSTLPWYATHGTDTAHPIYNYAPAMRCPVPV